MTTAGGIAFHGNADGNFQAYDAKTGNLLWQWQTGAGADAPSMTYMIDGVQYLTIASGGVVGNGELSQRGDMLWTFALNGASPLGPLPAPTPPVILVADASGNVPTTPGAAGSVHP
jgi:hypothetical protein